MFTRMVSSRFNSTLQTSTDGYLNMSKVTAEIWKYWKVTELCNAAITLSHFSKTKLCIYECTSITSNGYGDFFAASVTETKPDRMDIIEVWDIL